MVSIPVLTNAQESLLLRFQHLDEIETKISDVLHMAGNALLELHRARPSFSQMKTNIVSFLTTLLDVEKSLANYVTQLNEISSLHPHEGSDYGSRKDYQMTRDRSRRVCYLVYELTLLNATHQAENAKHTPSNLPRHGNL